MPPDPAVPTDRDRRPAPSRLGAAVRRARLLQVGKTSALMRRLTRLRPLASLVGRLGKWPLTRPAVDLVAGYNRVFPDLAAALKVVDRYGRPGHGSAENAHALQDFMSATRPSDYPVLFHLSRLPLEGLRVFDLGGTTGDLFYLYGRYIGFPETLRWTVHDLSPQMERGRELARQRSESRLQFSDDVDGASGHDVLLVSGSLHYFDFTLADYLAGLDQPPRHVIINRTPLVDAPTAATVQYTHGVMVACTLFNRAELVAGMQQRGYRLADSWRVLEFSIGLPYDPDYWVREYSGAYFRRGD